jgi:hypothetical protein
MQDINCSIDSIRSVYKEFKHLQVPAIGNLSLNEGRIFQVRIYHFGRNIEAAFSGE